MKRWQKGTLRVFSRHPSHNCLRNFFEVPVTTCLRLGSITENNSVIQINTVQSIQNCMDKLKMKNIFQKAGVRSPNHYTVYNNGSVVTTTAEGNRFISLDNIKYPVLAKRTFRSRGAGMKKILNVEQLQEFLSECANNSNRHRVNPYYLEEYANFTREYRLHITENGCFYTNRKLLRQDAGKRWCRNDENCVWILEENEKFNKPETWNDIVNDCVKALKALGLDIAGFDVRVNRKGDWRIIEANSACSLGDITRVKYVEAIQQIIKQKQQ